MMVSPNELMAEANERMLGGREPENRHDHLLVLNFLAANIRADVAESAIKLMRCIYPVFGSYVTDRDVEECVLHFVALRN